MNTDHRQRITDRINEHAALVKRLAEELTDDIAASAQLLLETLLTGGKILLCGNGGSAADAQHIATELTGRFQAERRALAAIALTTDSSALTAIGNDYGMERVFARQVEALARPGDTLVAISTSGNSANVVRAVEQAHALKVRSIGLLGRDGGAIAPLCAQSVVVPDQVTARIQEMHILIGHLWCEIVEQAITAA